MATPEDTFLQLAGYLTLVDLVIAGDALVRLGLTTSASLTAAAQKSCGRGVRLARRAAALVRPRVDSPMETRTRLLIVLAGLPEPEVNRDVYDGWGGWLARPDLSYVEQRIAIEYDGAVHLQRRRRNRDVRRQRAYADHGWEAIVLVDSDIFTTPGLTVIRVWRALQEGAHVGVPADTSDGWRSHLGPRSIEGP